MAGFRDFDVLDILLGIVDAEQPALFSGFALPLLTCVLVRLREGFLRINADTFLDHDQLIEADRNVRRRNQFTAALVKGKPGFNFEQSTGIPARAVGWSDRDVIAVDHTPAVNGAV